MTDLRDKIAEIVSDAECSDDRGCGSRVLDPDVIADAILAVLTDMIPDLVWDGVEDDCFMACDMGTHGYHLLVFDTLERSGDYAWTACYIVGTKEVPVSQGKGTTLVDAKAAANAHHRAQLIKAMGWTI